MLTPLLKRQLSEDPNTEAALQAMGQISSPEEVAKFGGVSRKRRSFGNERFCSRAKRSAMAKG